jgi:hypothetical protein
MPGVIIRLTSNLVPRTGKRSLYERHAEFRWRTWPAFGTVREALGDERPARFVHNLMLGFRFAARHPGPGGRESGPAPGMVPDRFRNPYLEHRWLAIVRGHH